MVLHRHLDILSQTMKACALRQHGTYVWGARDSSMNVPLMWKIFSKNMPAVSYELVQTIEIGTCSTAELVFVNVSQGAGLPTYQHTFRHQFINKCLFSL